jgi:hypothetical protein
LSINQLLSNSWEATAHPPYSIQGFCETAESGTAPVGLARPGFALQQLAMPEY